MRFAAFVFIILTIFTGSESLQDNDTWARYVPRTLSQVITLHAAKVLDDPDVLMTFSDGSKAILANDTFPSRVKVIYTGQSRTIPAERKNLIKDWVTKTHGKAQEYAKLFEKEFLFIEGSNKYWIPVQTQLIKYFERELKNGEEMAILTIWIGARKKSDKIDWVFLINEFEKE